MSTIREIQARQGIPTPKSDADWKKYREDKALRRAKNVVNAREVLDRNGVHYVEGKDHDGLVLFTIVEPGTDFIYYRPEEGRWNSTLDIRVHFGVRNLVRYLKGVHK